MDAALGQVCSLLSDMHMDVDAYGLGNLDTLKKSLLLASFNQPTQVVGSIEITKQTSTEPAQTPELGLQPFFEKTHHFTQLAFSHSFRGKVSCQKEIVRKETKQTTFERETINTKL